MPELSTPATNGGVFEVLTARRALRLTVIGLSVVFMAVVVVGSLSGFSLAPVLSDSMQPAIGRGDAVLIRMVDTRTLRAGDIPVIVPPGQSEPVAHRITRVTAEPAGPAFITRGDANPLTDPWRSTVTAPQTPKVIATLPYAGQAHSVFGAPSVRPLLVGALGLLLTVVAVRAVASSPAPPEPRRSTPSGTPPSGTI